MKYRVLCAVCACLAVVAMSATSDAGLLGNRGGIFGLGILGGGRYTACSSSSGYSACSSNASYGACSSSQQAYQQFYVPQQQYVPPQYIEPVQTAQYTSVKYQQTAFKPNTSRQTWTASEAPEPE
jgi:hypothetical protein